MQMQQWVPLALLSSYKIFLTAGNNINLPRSSCTIPDMLCSDHISYQPLRYVRRDRWTDLFDDDKSSFSRLMGTLLQSLQ